MNTYLDRRRILLLLSCLFILLPALSAAPLLPIETVAIVTTPAAPSAPVIDGRDNDPCWRDAAPLGPFPLPGLSVKVCRDRENFYLLVQFSAPAEERRHRPWVWNQEEQNYVPGPDREAAVAVIIAPPAYQADGADFWFWGASRTDPVGHADDGRLRSAAGPPEAAAASPSLEIIPDRGGLCWFSRFFGQFAGLSLPRFYHRRPAGSAADVTARGNWQAGRWTVEFSRRLDTGHPDDVVLKGPLSITVQTETGFARRPSGALIRIE